MRTAITVTVTEVEASRLRRYARQSAGRISLRARIVLLAALGWTNAAIAAKLRTDPHTVARWRSRFSAKRLAGIENEARRGGRKRRVRGPAERRILRLTKKLRQERRPCSSREVAKLLGLNHMLVHRVWKDHGLAP